ncbi:hypothetical protein J3B02_004472, partial [Coemansia erecta]
DGTASETAGSAVAVANTSRSTLGSKSKSGSKASVSQPVNEETASEAKTAPAKEKKGAKGTRKTPAPKEKKPRAKSKAAAAKAAAAAAAVAATVESNSFVAGSSIQPDTEKPQSRAASQQPTTAIANNANGSNNPGDAVASGEQAPLLARSSGVINSVAVNGAGADLVMSPQQQTLGAPIGSGPVTNAATPTAAGTTAGTPVAGQPPAQSSPAMQNQIPNNIPAQTVRIAMAQLNAHLMNIAKQTGRPPMELPTYITKEYLQANPQYYAMLRQQIAHVVAQQKQKAQQQIQQGAANIAGSGPICSPQMRPGLPPNMAAMSQIIQTMQQNNAASASTPAANGGSGAAGVAGANPAAGPRPMMMSPNMNASAANGNPAPTSTNQLQPTREDIILIREYCRMANIQLNGLQDPRFIILIAKAKSGELRNLLMMRYQAMNAQQQQLQPQLAVGTGSIRPNGIANSGAQTQPQQQQLQSQPQPQTQPQGQAQVQAQGQVQVQSPQDQQQQQPQLPQQQQAGNSNTASQDSTMQTNQISGASGVAAQTPSMVPVNLPRDLSNLTSQDKQRLLEMMMQRKRETQQNGQPGQLPNQSAVSNQQAALASMAAMLQQQRQMNMTAANNMQSPMVRPAQLGGAANQVQQRPISAIIGSPTPAQANLTGQMSAGQLLQHMASANMTPQQRQELLMRLHQM